MAGNRLGEVAEVVMGQSPDGSTCNDNGNGLPLLNGPTEFGQHHPTPVQFTTDPRKKARVGDILFCVRGSTTGRMNWADQEYAIGRGVAAIRHHKGRDYQSFVRALIDYRLPGLLAEATGSTFPNVSYGQLVGLECDLPALLEQRSISHILGTLDNKIELNRRMNETLEAMARAIFKSWFVVFDPVKAKAEDRQPAGMDASTAALFPDSFQDSELGPIPKGWSVLQIRDIANNIQYGLTQSASIAPIGPRFLRITDIQGGRVDWNTVPYCGVTPEEHERYRLRPADVLVARTGASTGENIWLASVPDAVFASYLVRFQFPNPAQARLVGAFMRTPSYLDYVAGCIGGSAQPNASAQVLASAKLVVPPDEVLARFADILAPADGRRAQNSDESNTLAAIRDALLPKLMSGEIRVKDVDRFAEGPS